MSCVHDSHASLAPDGTCGPWELVQVGEALKQNGGAFKIAVLVTVMEL
jgi:hypothetical protein